MTDGPDAPIDISGDTPPPARKRSRGKKILVWSLGLVFVLAVGFAVLVALAIQDETEKDDAVQAGQCAAVTGFGTPGADLVAAPCSDPKANYSVAVRLAGGAAKCPAGDYAVFTQTARIGSDFTLCLVPNWASGRCYVNTPTATDAIDCSAGKARGHIKVTEVFPGTTNQKKCTKGGYVSTFSQPPTVYCYKDL